MKVVILCGGEGTRLRDISEAMPKPMFPIGGKPIVWHIMKYYASFGFKKFVLCLGFKSEIFVDYFLHYRTRNSDMTLTLTDDRTVQCHDVNAEADWEVTLAHTGQEAMTGCRVSRAAKYITDDHFLLTYGDGLAAVDLPQLINFHEQQGKMVTISAVHPSGRFGEMDIQGARVVEFNEKPQTTSGYINGGFMVVRRQFVADYLRDDPALVLEQEPLIRAAREGNVTAFCHDGYWQCMDTPREYKLLNQLWESGRAPWKRW